MQDCPLGFGMFFNPHGYKPGEARPAWLGQSYQVLDRNIIGGSLIVQIVRNEEEHAVDAGTKLTLTLMTGLAYKTPHGETHHAVVEDGYKGGVPTGCWFRAVLRTRMEVLLDTVNVKLDRVLDALGERSAPDPNSV